MDNVNMVTAAVALLAFQGEFFHHPMSQILEGRNGSHQFRIEIRCESFKPRGRKITWKKDDEYCYYPAINGRRTWVSDGLSPEDIKRESALDFLVRRRAREVRKFIVTVDGKQWKVPQRLYEDLLNLNMNRVDCKDYGQAWIDRNGSRLVLKQSGSDAGGGYKAIFTFRPFFKVERQIWRDNTLVRTNWG